MESLAVRRLTAASLALGMLALLRPAPTEAADAAGDASFFRARIAPVLETRCVQCHGEGTSKGGLWLTTRAGLLKGGTEGPAIVPGKPDESVLLEQVGGDPPEMPKKGDPLSPVEV